MPSYRIALLVVVMLLIAAVFALSTSPAIANVPPGVNPELWHQLSPKLGIALRVERGLGRAPEFHGTLMLKEGDSWRAVILREPQGVVPAR